MANLTKQKTSESKIRLAESMAGKVADSLLAVLHASQHVSSIQAYLRERDTEGSAQALLRELQPELAMVIGGAVYAYVETLDRINRVERAMSEQKNEGKK